MSRTDIDIDDDLVERVMLRYKVATRQEAVDLALRLAVGDLFPRGARSTGRNLEDRRGKPAG